ncbi:MAG: type II toxin-antitoxin system RelB/DinJ family antitoxin [Bacteroidales bacterium]|nr:type II toxin-antitoxin system RelB/DinJ family antitoxin [Bacteroidales bacterium]
MAQVSMTVRMDSQLKASFDALCAEFGMSANTAMNVFANAVVQQRCIPFIIRAEKMEDTESFKTLRTMAESGMFPELTLDEINKEIALARSEKN